MTSAVLAPELSATFTIDSCWIMVGLPYRARSMISTRRHRLSFDSGRVSTMRTVSPTFAEFSSSWAFRRFVRVTILPYTGCGTRRSIATTTVFCILSLTTRPVRVFRVCGRAVCSLVISAMVSSPRSARALELALAQDGLQPRDVLADPPQAQRIVQRLGRAAEPQAEPLLLQARDPRTDLVQGEFPDLVSLHRCAPPHGQRTSS